METRRSQQIQHNTTPNKVLTTTLPDLQRHIANLFSMSSI